MLTGRPERLWVLDFGLFRVAEDGRVIGIPGFAIRTDAGETVLVDGGFPERYAADPEAGARDRLDGFGQVLACGAANLPRAQLALAGLARPDLLVLTHSHIDHVGALDLFPGAPLVLGAAERALPRPICWPGARPMAWPRRPTIPVDADTCLAPGLTLLSTPGHTVGHLSLLVELPETGAVLLTGDAISRPAEAEGGFDGAADPAEAERSAARLAAIARSTGAFVMYGHDPAQWDQLRRAPDCYR